MTRINCVDVSELCDEHLLAEYYELPRVFKLAKSVYPKMSGYRFGSGHVKFFYDKLEFLYLRQCKICDELTKRGFNLTYSPHELVKYMYTKTRLWNNWTPDNNSIYLSMSRLNQRVSEMNKVSYYKRRLK